jgi:uncharacterized membrane protein HdeD (DUF308 family)
MAAGVTGFGIEGVKGKWGWFLGLGVLMIIVGIIALTDTIAATVVSVILLGWLLVVSAVFHLFKCFHARAWRGFFLDLVGFIFDVVLAFVFLTNPGIGALSLTLVLAAFFFAGGLVRIFGALAYDLPHKGWALLDGAISTLLGILLFVHWPLTGLWFIGFAIGFALVFRGWAWMMLGFRLRSHPAG